MLKVSSRPRGGGHVHCDSGPSRVTFVAPGRHVPTSWLQKAKAARRPPAARPASGWLSRSSCDVTCTSGGAEGEAFTTLAPMAAAATTAAQTSVPLRFTTNPPTPLCRASVTPRPWARKFSSPAGSTLTEPGALDCGCRSAGQLAALGSGWLATGEAADEDRHLHARRDPGAATRLLVDDDAVLALVRHRSVENEDLEAGALDVVGRRRLILTDDVRNGRRRLRVRPRGDDERDGRVASQRRAGRRRLLQHAACRLVRLPVHDLRPQAADVQAPERDRLSETRDARHANVRCGRRRCRRSGRRRGGRRRG